MIEFFILLMEIIRRGRGDPFSPKPFQTRKGKMDEEGI